jgi:hypothetical protein
MLAVCKWLGRDPREFLGMETNEAAKKPRSVVHFKKKKTVQVETAKALGELILAAQRATLGFAFVLRAHCFHRVLPALCQGRCASKAPPCERTQPLYPRGPRSGPGYAVPVHHHLIGPIRPTRGHISISPSSGLYEMPSLCLFS